MNDRASRRQAWERQFTGYPDRPQAPWGASEPDPELRAAVAAGWLPRSGRVLDLGCGNGKNAAFLADQGFRVVGVDFSRRGLAQAAARSAQVSWACGDALALPFADASFDAAIDIGCLHGLAAEDWPQYEAELTRVLEPGAAMILRAFSDRHPAATEPWGEFRELDLTFAPRERIRELLQRRFLVHETRETSWGERAGWPFEHHAWVLHLQRRWRLEDLPFREIAVQVTTLRALREIEGPFQRAYLGHEFCERRLPGTDQIREAHALCQERGWALTLVTPPVTRIDVLQARLAALAEVDATAEVVVNDLGALRLLGRDHPGLKPVLGRLLTRHRRDPRLATRAPDVGTRARLGHMALHSAETRAWMREAGVQRAEIDNPPFELDTSPSELPLSLYYPYVYLTMTRTCTRDCDPSLCAQPVVLRHPDLPALVLRGGAQFYRNSVTTNFNAPNLDRLIWQPEPPG